MVGVVGAAGRALAATVKVVEGFEFPYELKALY